MPMKMLFVTLIVMAGYSTVEPVMGTLKYIIFQEILKPYYQKIESN
ncbi:hypothetical protein [Clostridium sp.]